MEGLISSSLGVLSPQHLWKWLSLSFHGVIIPQHLWEGLSLSFHGVIIPQHLWECLSLSFHVVFFHIISWSASLHYLMAYSCLNIMGVLILVIVVSTHSSTSLGMLILDMFSFHIIILYSGNPRHLLEYSYLHYLQYNGLLLTWRNCFTRMVWRFIIWGVAFGLNS